MSKQAASATIPARIRFDPGPMRMTSAAERHNLRGFLRRSPADTRLKSTPVRPTIWR